MSVPGPKAALTAPKFDFWFTPESRRRRPCQPCRFRATTGLMHRRKLHPYSITSSARVSSCNLSQRCLEAVSEHLETT